MESLSPLVIELLRQDYGLTDQAIASRCGVSRVHINYVLHGKRQASRELETRLSTLLAECDRGERTLLPNTLARGKVSRGEPQKGPRVQPQRPVPKPEPHFTPSPRSTNEQASGLSAWESKQASHISPSPVQPPAPPARPSPPAAPRRESSIPVVARGSPTRVDPPSPPQPQASSETCIACRRPGVPTRLYDGKWLCQWDAAARGYRAHAAPTTFTPLQRQQAPTYPQPLPVPAPVMAEPEPVEDPPPDPSTWKPITDRERWAYNMGKLCLACRARGETVQVSVSFRGARSVRLCEECASRFIPE